MVEMVINPLMVHRTLHYILPVCIVPLGSMRILVFKLLSLCEFEFHKRLPARNRSCVSFVCQAVLDNFGS